MFPIIGCHIILCEDYYHTEEIEKNSFWRNYQFIKGDKFYVERKADPPYDYILKVISAKDRKLVNLKIKHNCFNNHKFSTDISEERNKKIEKILE